MRTIVLLIGCIMVVLVVGVTAASILTPDIARPVVSHLPPGAFWRSLIGIGVLIVGGWMMWSGTEDM